MTRKYVRTGQRRMSREEWLSMFKTVLSKFRIPIPKEEEEEGGEKNG